MKVILHSIAVWSYFRIEEAIRLRKAIALALVAVLLFTNITVARAATLENDTELAEYKLGITTRINELENYLDQDVSGEYGLLFKLRTLNEYGMYYKQLTDYQSLLGFSDKEEEFYRKRLAAYYLDFNNEYAKKTDEVTHAVRLKTSIKDASKYSKVLLLADVMENNSKVVIDFYSKYLEELQKKYEKRTSQSEKDQFLTENSTVLSNLYKGVLVYQDVPNTLYDLTPTVDGKHDKYTIDGQKNNTTINKIIEDLCETYKELLQYGRKMSQKTVDSSLDFDENESLLEIFSNTTVSGGKYQFQDSVELSQLYMAMFSCSSVYTPFISYVGSSEYKAALRKLANDDDEATRVESLYDSVKDLRKPLYKRSLDDNGNPTGPAKLLSIQDFIDDIDSGSVGSLVTIQGSFHYNSDAKSWIYSRNEMNYNNQSGIIGDGIESSSSTTESNTTESSSTTEDNDGTAQAKKKSELDLFDNEVALADDNTAKPSAKSDDKIDTSNYSKLAKSVKNVIIVGDQKAADTVSALKTQGATDKTLKNNKVYQFSATKANYAWFTGSDTGLSSVTKILSKDKKTKYTVVIYLSSADIGTKKQKEYRSNLASKINSLAKDYPNSDFVVVSATPVNESVKGVKVKNEDIKTYNKEFKAELQQSVSYVDVNGAMFANDKLADGFSFEKDGKNFTDTSLLKLFATVLDNSIETTTNSSDASSEDSTKTSESTTETSTTSKATEQTDADELSSAVFASDTITDESAMTQPILWYGTKYQRVIDNMTTVLLKNIMSNTVDISNIADKKTRYLYVNVFGDIVTDDNMIVFPGYCNPSYYKVSSDYNPYSVGFMNSYPAIVSRSVYFRTSSEKDIGKYVMMGETDKESIQDINISAFLITGNDTVNEVGSLMVKNLYPYFYVNTTDNTSILGAQRYVFGSKTSWRSSTLYNYSPVVMTDIITVNNKVLFPYDSSSDTKYEIACAIAKNAYQFIAYDRSLGAYVNVGKLNDNYVLHNVVIAGIQGTNNPLGYTKDELMQYEQYVEGTNDRIHKQVVELSSNLIDKASDVTGVIGLESSYTSKILGTALRVIRQYVWVFFAVIILFLIFAFARYVRDLMEVILLSIISAMVSFGFVYVLPVYLPMFYNIVINNMCENLTYEVLGTKTEQYDADNDSLVQLGDDGNYKYQSSSLTLYKVGWRDLDDFYDSVGVSAEDVSGGKTQVISQEAGIFVEGDSIKINTHILYKTLQIYGKYEATNGSSVYQLTANKTVSNNVDYYSPFYQIVDGYIRKVNLMAYVYRLPRSTSTYSDGKNKDNYLVYSYVNSPLFLTNGSYDVVLQEDADDYMSDSDAFKAESKSLEEDLTNAFGDNSDWLGISDIFIHLSEESKATLWAQTMQANGYYDQNWNPDTDKISDLVSYVNRQTKSFVFDMEDSIGKLSDSTMIKLISTKASIAFAQRVSDYGNWLYPFNLCYEELSLKDVLLSVFTNDYSKYISMNSDIAEFVGEEHGWFTLIIFDFMVICMYLFVNVIKVAIPILYLLLGIVILLRILQQQEVKVPLKGYAKVSALIFIDFTLFDVALVFIRKTNGSAICVYVMALVTLLCLWVIGSVLSAVLKNVMEFGNSAISAKLEGIMHTTHLDSVVNNVHLRSSNSDNVFENKNPELEEDDGDPYSLDAPVDGYYDYDSDESVDDLSHLDDS